MLLASKHTVSQHASSSVCAQLVAGIARDVPFSKGHHMLVREILDETEAFPTIVTDTTVKEAADVMRAQDVRAIPVVEGDRLIGIVTDWDIVDAFAADGDSLAARPVSAIMTSDKMITIDIAATAADATAKLRLNRVHHLPVL
ncbi:MAG: putative signal-transduction protein containing cAMP-binding and domain, partial [Thermoleophilia bacterium]|nr:putative signal-transduction protein containing cAMP-binding and domain [Thermoleophilia bacterium]